VFGVIVEGRLYVLSNRDQQFPTCTPELQLLPRRVKIRPFLLKVDQCTTQLLGMCRRTGKNMQVIDSWCAASLEYLNATISQIGQMLLTLKFRSIQSDITLIDHRDSDNKLFHVTPDEQQNRQYFWLSPDNEPTNRSPSIHYPLS
jgi:hypothetical protein